MPSRGSVVVVTLAIITIQGFEPPSLVLVLDPLGDHGEFQVMRQSDDRLDDFMALGVEPIWPTNERSIFTVSTVNFWK